MFSILALILALLCLFASILNMAGMIWAVYMVKTHYDPQIGLAFLYPALGYMFVVGPGFLLAFIFALIGMLISGGKGSPAMRRSIIAIFIAIGGAVLPFMPLLAMVFI